MKRFFLLCIAAFALASCSKVENNDIISKPGYISGYAQKGYLVEGSEVRADAYDAGLIPTGDSFSSTVTGCLGAFSIKVGTFDAAYVEVKAQGYYFDEVEGKTTTAPITLEAIIKSGDPSVNLNLFTTITKDRIKKLILSGKTFDEARIQAQTEFYTTVNMAGANMDFTKINLTGGSDVDALLLLTTCAIQHGRTPDELMAVLKSTAAEFEKSGTLSEESSKLLFQPGQELNMLTVYRNLVDYYTKNGIPTSQLPPYEKYFGRRGASTQYLRICENLDFPADSLVALEGKSGKITINTNVRFQCVPNVDWIKIDSTKELFTGVHEIYITVAPNKGAEQRKGNIKFMDYDPKPYTGLGITQEGHYSRLILDISDLQWPWPEPYAFGDLKPGALVSVNGTTCTVEDYDGTDLAVTAPTADSYIVSYPVSLIRSDGHGRVVVDFPKDCFSLVPIACGALNWRHGRVKLEPVSQLKRFDVASIGRLSLRAKVNRIVFSLQDGGALAGKFTFNVFPGTPFSSESVFSSGEITEMQLNDFDYNKPYVELTLPPLGARNWYYLKIDFYDKSGANIWSRTEEMFSEPGRLHTFSFD